MWELYAFWAFIPFLIDQYNVTHQIRTISWLSFIVIAIGAAGCILGGFISKKTGSFRVALYALITSGVCCLLSPWIFQVDSIEVLIAFILLWGFSVVADSPQFSALVARYAPTHVKGSAITIVTSIGFAITIVSIQLLSHLQTIMGDYLAWILAPGPIVGIVFMMRNK
jgi:MFS family permease